MKKYMVIGLVAALTGCAQMASQMQSGQYLQFSDQGKVFMQFDMFDSEACQRENNAGVMKNGITVRCSPASNYGR